jgi:arsenite methyltransferase
LARSPAPRVALCLCLVLLLAPACGTFKRWAYGEGPDRDAWQQPERVIEALGLQHGDRVADLGAGGGYFTWGLAEAVGPSGQVYAIDVDPDMTEYLTQEALRRGASNVQVVLAAPDDPHLPSPGVDLLFSCDTYHHLQDRSAYFSRLRGSLRPGGRVAIVELKGVGWFERWFGHFTPAEEIREEMRAAGYRLVAQHDFLERQHFLVFAPEEQAP